MLLLTPPPHRIAPHPLSLGEQIFFFAYLAVGMAILLLPTWVALLRHRSGAGRIFLANLFLSWTGIGWILALVFAFRDPQPRVLEPYVCRNCYTIAPPRTRRGRWFFGDGAWNAAALYGGLVPMLSCPRCHAPHPIPLDSPAGREIAARTRASSSFS